MNIITIDNKIDIIINGVLEGLYGHVLITKAFWDQLDHHCEQYFEEFKKQDKVNHVVSQIESAILKHPLSRYPLSGIHLRDVIQWLKSCLSRNAPGYNLSREIDDLLHESSSIPPKFIFKSLRRNNFKEDTTVTLLEENEIIGNGTTGLTSWQGALYLTDWLVAGNIEIKDCHIVELGAGTGFLGLHLLKSIPSIKSYNFTDGHPKVVSTIWFNLLLNLREESVSEREMQACVENGPPQPGQKIPLALETASGCEVKVDLLDWTQYDNETTKNSDNIDFILGSDITYHKSLIPPLCNVLRTMLEKNSKTKAYIACTERKQETLQCFEDGLKKINANFRIIAKGTYSPTEALLCSDVLHQPTRIYLITAK